jgi:hypothetical protein
MLRFVQWRVALQGPLRLLRVPRSAAYVTPG